MLNRTIKSWIRNTVFRDGSIQKIKIGPLRGTKFIVSEATGLSPLYSGMERAHQSAFKRIVNKGDVAIDIGASWGIHTLYLSKLVGANGLVISFEAYEKVFKELEINTEINYCNNVELYPVAISNISGVSDFVPGELLSTGRILTTTRAKSKDGVKTYSIDDFIEKRKLEKIKLIKIDTEGSEGNILKGATKTIEHFKPYFIIDLHSPEQDALVAQILTKHGYELKRLSGPPILNKNSVWPDLKGVWGSIVAIPGLK